MVFICKKCKKAFRKDAREFEDADEYCPHCDNHFVLEAKTPKASLQVEGEDARVDSRYALPDCTTAKILISFQDAQGRTHKDRGATVHIRCEGGAE
ncbi:hypothetical protein N0V83_000151 [Neocucurbitaria cava]|uniref:Zinc finger protein n=1 Tax=Neocucurbitaria cava TaxID=798079 RepID=A0A9W8YGI9_9PLEO|nr:hypothetical protein N0V83_000151 [Neocucurbitaria cava]